MQILEWRKIEIKDRGGESSTRREKYLQVQPVPEILSLSVDNQTLSFPPFSSSAYTASIHATTYKCVARNEAGVVSSPPTDLRAGKKS